MQKLDQLVSPLILKGQSLSHIYANHAKEISCYRRTIYKYIGRNVFSARNIDLPRKVKYKARKSFSQKIPINREYCRGKTYKEFSELLHKNPGLSVVEMDTVEGQKGGKVLLTLLFRNTSLMLIFLMDSKSQECVRKVFDDLTKSLGLKNIKKLFQVILTDRDSEFQAANVLGHNPSGKKRTNIYYCDPSAPYQKGAAENNHTSIRRILPKGTSFDEFTQEKVNLMMNHTNSYRRKSLGDRSSYEMFGLLHDKTILYKLGAVPISPDDIRLLLDLLKICLHGS